MPWSLFSEGGEDVKKVHHIDFGEKRISIKINSYIHPAKSCTICTDRNIRKNIIDFDLSGELTS